MPHHISSHYDHTASHIHEQHVELPLKEYAERFTFFKLLGSVEDLQVLDLGCGDGSNTTSIKRRGAARVLGVDESSDMLDLAHRRERQENLGVKYKLADAARLGVIGQFDVVTATQLFHYATSQEHFAAMCKTIYDNLRPGGRFVSVGFSPFTERQTPDMRKYSIRLRLPDSLKDGDEMTGQIFLDTSAEEPTLEVTHHYWGHRTYERSLRGAGLRNIAWHLPEVSSQGLAKLGPEFWEDFLLHPFFIGLTCDKPL